MTPSHDLYELFLALAPPRIAAARDALAAPDRNSRLSAALVPLAVDALLLGAEGLAELARAAAESQAAEALLTDALDRLEQAAAALGSGDASGARVDESELKAKAKALYAEAPREPAPKPKAAATNDAEWAPDLAEDMISAFLDECNERVDGLAEKLLLLEERRDDRDLVAALFRDLHTLKGSSAFAGLTQMNLVAHAAEDLVADLRAGRRSADRGVVDALLAALDVLRAIVERAQRRAPIDVETSDVLARLRSPEQAATKPTALTAQAGAAATEKASSPATQATLRIEFEKVDLLLNLVGELVLARSRLLGAAERHAALPQDLAQIRRLVARALDPRGVGQHRAVVEELQRSERVLGESFGDLESGLASLGLSLGQMRDHVMKLRMIPIARLFTKYQRTVRELSHKLGKEVKVELIGAETELDKVLVERLDDPLLHLVRNAIDHGLETPHVREAAGKPRAGTLTLWARQRGGSIVVAIRDDGGGLDVTALKIRAVEKGLITEASAATMPDREAFDLIFQPGFSTAKTVSDVSGRGVGMDVVREAIARLKGTIAIESERGEGTTVELRLPLTLAITQVLAARVGGESVAIPLDAVVSARAVSSGDLEVVASSATLRVGDDIVPVLDLTAILGLEATADLANSAAAYVIVVDVSGELFGLLAQQLLGRHEVVVKSLGPLLLGAPFVAGATIVDDRVLLLLDLVAIAAVAGSNVANIKSPLVERARRSEKILVVEDSDVIRESVRRAFEARGFEVLTAADGVEALAIARDATFDAVSTDVVMPNLDGYELTRALRADPRFSRVPIVMLTSKDARLDQLRGLDAGADAYLTKPVDAGELVRRIEDLLARAKAET